MTTSATPGTHNPERAEGYIEDSLGYDRDSSQCLQHTAFPWAMMALAVALMTATTDVGDVSRSANLPIAGALAASAAVMVVIAFIAWLVIRTVTKKVSKNYITSPFRHQMDMANVVEPVVYEISFKDTMKRFFNILPFLTMIFLSLDLSYIFIASVLTPEEMVNKVVSDAASDTMSVVLWAFVVSVAVQVYRHYLKTFIVRGRSEKLEAPALPA